MQERYSRAISPKHPVGKKPIRVRVLMLDGRIENFILSPRCPGQEFFDLVVQTLKLQDTDYFDLEFEDAMGNKCWLDHFKPMYKPVSQILRKPAQFSFKVKFYTPHLNLLTNKLTRRLFAMQVKRDLIDGELNCGENTAALLTAFILQAELGDREREDRAIASHLENMRLSKQYSYAFISKVLDLHSNLGGMSEGEANYRLLDAARKLEFYGLKLHPAKDNGGILLNLGVTHAGLFLYQAKTKLNHFSWSKIRKLSFKRSKFLIKLHPGTESFGQSTVEFTFDSRNSCKNFWKKCLEHHAFFRSREMRGEAGAGGGGLGGFGKGIWTSSAPSAHPYSSQPSLCYSEDTGPKGSFSSAGGGGVLYQSANLKNGRNQALFSKGSSYRYCGRTQHQLLETSYSSAKGNILSEQRSMSVGRLDSEDNLNYFGPSSLCRSAARVDGDHGSRGSGLLRPQRDHFRGSISSTVAADFGMPTSSLPDHYQLLFLSTPIRRPLSTRYRASSVHSVEQDSLQTESLYKVGSQLLESEHGARVPRVFSASVLKAPKRRRGSGSTTNTNSLSVRSATTRPSDSAIKDCPSASSFNGPEYLDPPMKHHSRTMHADRSSGDLTPPNALNKTSSFSEATTPPSFLTNGAQISTSISPSHGLRTNEKAPSVPWTRAFSTVVHHSRFAENYDNEPEDDDNYDDNATISDDSLLQHPLSVCASRAVSSNDLYRSESIDFHYPVCALDELNSPPHQEDDSRKEVDNFPIVSPFARESPLDWTHPDSNTAFVDTHGLSSYPSQSAPTSRRASNYTTLGEDFEETSRMEEEPSSLAPALSIGAISAITGVSCFEDDDNDCKGGESVGACEDKAGKTHPAPFSGPSSPAIDTISSSVGQRARSEPVEPVVPEHHFFPVDVRPRIARRIHRQRKKHRTRKREPNIKQDYINWDLMASSVQQNAYTLSTTSRIPRKKSVPPYHDRTFHLAKELSMTERTYVHSLQLLLKPSPSSPAPGDNFHVQITRLVSPIYLHHSALLQSAFTRVVAWEKAAISAASARTRYQSAVANAHKAQCTRRERAVKQIQAGRQRPQRPQKCRNDNAFGNDFGGKNELSDSSTSVSGVPRSSSRNELPPSIEGNRSQIPPAEGCYLTTSSTSYSSFVSSSDNSDVEHLSQITETPLADLASAEAELRETTRCLADLARIADVYRQPLLEVLVSLYECFLHALPGLLKEHISKIAGHDESGLMDNYPSRLALLRAPARRLWYYTQAFRRLATFYGTEHPDLDDCNALTSRLSKVVLKFNSVYQTTEALVLAVGFWRDPQPAVKDRTGVNKRRCRRVSYATILYSLVSEPHFHLIRVGYLEKMSSKGQGFQPRMALLFTDRLVYCARSSGTASMQLKVHGVIALHNAAIEPQLKTSVSFSEGVAQGETSRRMSCKEQYSFAIFVFPGEKMEEISSDKSVHSRTHRIVFAAPNEEQKCLWLDALYKVLGRNKENDEMSSGHLSSPPVSPLEAANAADITLHDLPGASDKSQVSSVALEKREFPSDVVPDQSVDYLGLLGPRSHIQQTVLRCSGLAYVCWHRRLTVSLDNVLNANECEISGYLLRKFKSSCGWQKLWTVFTDFTLFFYKSAEDFTPIASLPLLGYRLESTRLTATSADAPLHKLNVLQLAYKSHIYYFRTDGPVSFERWRNALSSALQTLSAEKKSNAS
uniref:FERM domain-containing protein n=1 Tax=Mesocestoides corti TaxID=53468 RepID=A0A5K3F785_MESCO